MKREPALLLGAVQTVLALVVAFGLELSAEQTGAILAASAALLAVWTRRSVYSPETVAQLVSMPADSTPPEV